MIIQGLLRELKGLFLVALACLVTIALVPSASWASHVNDDTVFELDGNTQDNAPAGQDWETPPTGPQTAMPIQDGTGNSIFTTGGSKDINDVSMWRWTDGAVPDKDNILQAAAVAKTLPNGDLAIYFAATRRANNGDAQVGFWFLQQEIVLSSDGTFGPATHTEGDVLVLANFSNGGSIATVQVFEWLSGAPVLINLVTGKCTTPGSYDACAVTNEANSAAPASWGYVPKSGTAGTFPPQSFFEGGINLSTVFEGQLPCFTSFLVETRSSTSITAQLKDFAEGSFILCKLSITKNCNAGQVNSSGTAIDYTFGGTVTNDGQGAIFDIIIEDDPGSCGDPFTITVNLQTQPVPGQLGPGASVAWTGSVTGSTSLGCTNTAVAKGKASQSSPTRNVISDPTTAECTTTVSNGISITKSCEPGTFLDEEGGSVVVKVGTSGQVCNTGQSQLTDVVVTHDPSATVTLEKTTLPPNDGSTDAHCADWSVTYTPSLISSGDGTGPGRYFFDDDVSVTAAKATIGSDPSLATASAGASCPICPEGSCPIP